MTRDIVLAANRRRAIWLTSIILTVALTVLVYLPGLYGDFVLDDFPNLLNNTALQVHSFSLEAFWHAALSSGSGTLRRPVSMVSFALNHYAAGFEPFSYKVVNLAIHVLCGLSLLMLTRRLLESYRAVRNPAFADTAIQWIPVIVSAFWMIHPINLTAVLYVVQRMTSLSALFTILGLIAFMAFRLRLYAGKRNWLIPLIVSLGCTLLGVLSKENAALAVLFALLIEAAIFRGRRQDGRRDQRVIYAFAILIGTPLIVATVYLLIHPDWLLNRYAGRSFSITERVLTETRVLAFYLQSLLLPKISSFGLYHDDFALSKGLFSPPSTALAVLSIIGATAGGLLLLRRVPLVGLGILWFFTGHLLESTVIPLELVYEHRNYLPSFGIIFALTYAGYAATRKSRLERVAPVLAVVAVIVFSSVTLVRAQQWQDNVDHAIAEAKNHPRSPRAVYMAGRIYANLYLTGGLQSADRAYEFLERAREIDRETILPSAALIMLAVKAKHPLKAEWKKSIIRRLHERAPTPSSVTTLRILTEDRRVVEAMGDPYVQQMLDASLAKVRATDGKRADLLTIYGSYCANFRGDYAATRRMFTEAVRIAPNELRYRLNLTQLLVAIRDVEAAKQSLAEAIRADKLNRHAAEILRLEKAISTMSAPG